MAIVTYAARDGSPLQLQVWFTDADGNMAEISGDPPAVRALEELFERCGLFFDDQTNSYCTSPGPGASADAVDS